MSKENMEVMGTKAVEVSEETKITKESIKTELDELLSKRNEYARSGAGNLVTKYENKIADKLKEYTAEAQKECFDKLKSKKNVMLEAAKVLSFDTLRLADDKDESTDEVNIKKFDPKRKVFDPKTLQDKTKPIGHDKSWVATVERLNFLLTSRRCVELGIDPETICSSYAMSEEADKITSLLFDAKKYDKNEADNILKHDMQVCVDEMVGEIYVGKGKEKAKVEVADSLVNYVLMVYQKKDNKKALSVTCAKHDAMRKLMLEVINRMAFGTEFTLNYQVKK